MSSYTIFYRTFTFIPESTRRLKNFLRNSVEPTKKSCKFNVLERIIILSKLYIPQTRLTLILIPTLKSRPPCHYFWYCSQRFILSNAREANKKLCRLQMRPLQQGRMRRRVDTPRRYWNRYSSSLRESNNAFPCSSSSLWKLSNHTRPSIIEWKRN